MSGLTGIDMGTLVDYEAFVEYKGVVSQAPFNLANGLTRGSTMQEVKQNTAVNVRITMRGAGDGLGLPGLTSVMVIGLCKNGDSAFFTITPVITDLGNGGYNLALTSAHTNTLGVASFYITATGAIPNDELMILVRVSDVDAVKTDTATALTDITTLTSDVTALSGDIATTLTNTTDLHKVAFGRWKIIGTQLLLYDVDNVAVIRTFDLKDDTDTPSNTKIFERIPV